MIEVKFRKIHPNAVVPKCANEGDMCFDLTAVGVEYNEENDSYIYHTGLAMETPLGFGANIFVRSKNAKTDCYLANHVGKVDSYGYRNEVLVIFKNRTSWEVRRMLTEWMQMKKSTAGVVFDEKESLGETVRKLKANIKGNKSVISPMDFAPYNVGDRVAQMEIVKIEDVKIVVTDELSDAKRGSGFGSSGN